MYKGSTSVLGNGVSRKGSLADFEGECLNAQGVSIMQGVRLGVV